MMWEVEFTNEFEAWWIELDEGTQVAIDAAVRLLEARGPDLPFPYSSKINGSRHSHMRELRVQHKGLDMGVVQSALSKIEHQDDIQISTLSRYIKSLGGSLIIIARFPDKEVVISQFD